MGSDIHHRSRGGVLCVQSVALSRSVIRKRPAGGRRNVIFLIVSARSALTRRASVFTARWSGRVNLNPIGFVPLCPKG
jgi:hypothetical protein